MADKFCRLQEVEVVQKARDGTSRRASGYIVGPGKNDRSWWVNLHTTPAIVMEFDEHDIASLE